MIIEKSYEFFIITNLFIDERTIFLDYVLIIFLSQHFHFFINQFYKMNNFMISNDVITFVRAES